MTRRSCLFFFPQVLIHKRQINSFFIVFQNNISDNKLAVCLCFPKQQMSISDLPPSWLTFGKVWAKQTTLLIFKEANSEGFFYALKFRHFVCPAILLPQCFCNATTACYFLLCFRERTSSGSKVSSVVHHLTNYLGEY